MDLGVVRVNIKQDAAENVCFTMDNQPLQSVCKDVMKRKQWIINQKYCILK